MTLAKKDADSLQRTAVRISQAEVTLIEVQEERREAIRQAAKNGATMREIADASNLSHQRVAQIIGGSE